MRSKFDIFFTVVLVSENNGEDMSTILKNMSDYLYNLFTDYEIVVVDNASRDSSLSVFKYLTQADGIPNLQVYALTESVDFDSAAWVGLENALGDYVVVFDPLQDDHTMIEVAVDKALNENNDLVLVRNSQKAPESLGYSVANASFNLFYRWFNGASLKRDAPRYRLLNKRVINYILQFRQPVIAYRQISIRSGFNKTIIDYSHKPTKTDVRGLKGAVDKGLVMLTSTTKTPMRIVTTLSLFGAAANMAYSIYVLAIALLKVDVAPGWVSLSLQQSGMFFLISLVLLVLGEYILQMAALSNEGPVYHVGQEFSSAKVTRREKLNIEKADNQLDIGVSREV
ncbi:MAG: glycosyltransferase [Bacteroidota bacterium]